MENQLNELNIKLAELKTKKATKNTKEYALAYYHKKNVPCMCVCGKMTTTFSIYRHRFSKAHLKLMEIQDLEKEIQNLQETTEI